MAATVKKAKMLYFECPFFMKNGDDYLPNTQKNTGRNLLPK